MKRFIKIIICLTAFLTIGVRTYAKENNGPDIAITTYDGSSVMISDGEVFYSSLPVTFTPDGDGGEDYYSISIDDGDSFGSYVRVDGCVTLYPDDETAPDGRWQIKFKNIKGETVVESSTYKVCFDTTPPKLDIDDKDGPDGKTADPTRMRICFSDNVSGVSRIISKCNEIVVGQMTVPEDEALTEHEFILDLTDVPDGSNTIETKCFDRAGNVSTMSFEFLSDKTDPDISISGIKDSECLSCPGKLYITASDADSDVYIDYVLKRDYKGEMTVTEVTNAPKDTTLAFESDGVYSVEAVAVDGAGNRSKNIRRDFVIDTTAPVVSIEGVSDNVDIRGVASVNVDVEENMYNNTKVDIMLSRTALGKTETLPVTGYYLEANHDIRVVNISTDGTYDIFVRATDRAGNASTASTHFRIDATAPEISVSGIEESGITRETPVIRFGAGDLFYDSTIMSYVLEKKEKDGYIPVDAKDTVMRSVRDHVDINVQKEGEFRLTCAASDRSGNSASRVVNFTVDHTPPVISDLKDIDNKFFKSFALPRKIASYVSDMTKVSASAFLNDLKMNDSDVIIEEGKYVLTILAEDAASNVSEGTATFIVDHTSPQIILGGFDREGNISKGSMITVSLLEDCDTLKSVRFNDRDIAVGPDNRAQIAVNKYGNYRLAVVAEDPAGNVTDTEINTGCFMYPSGLGDYLRTEKTISAHMAPIQNDIDYRALAIGLLSVLSGTFGLAYRTFLRD